MKLDQVTLEIRPRSAWEAVDLGLLMAKRWWLPMMKIWLLVSFPVFVFTLLIPDSFTASWILVPPNPLRRSKEVSNIISLIHIPFKNISHRVILKERP